MIQTRTSTGMTLIELLCTIAIIGILAGLLLSPASRALGRAKDAEWANKAYRELERVVTSLQAHYQVGAEADRLSIQELYERAIIDLEELNFLTDRRVTFTPFASADPDDEVVIEVHIPRSFLTDPANERVPKKRITNPDKSPAGGGS